MIKYSLQTLVLITMMSMSVYAESAEQSSVLKDLQSRWADVNYQKKSKQQKNKYKQLVKDSISNADAYPESAEILTWAGIINSSYAGVASGLSGLSYAKDAKKYFEKAISINGDALSGSAYTSLGTLYFKVPGWPLGFGDEDKAVELLQKGLKINPDGIDSNYFYADYLYVDNQYQVAKEYLQKALKASARENRPLADKGRKNDIMQLLAEIESELD